MRRLIHLVAVTSMLLVLPATLLAEQVPWITDLEKAFEIAKQDSRPLLLHFWSPDCIPCLQLEETVFNQPSVTRTVGELFVPVKINAKEHPRIAAQYKIRSVPWDVILTPAGDEVYRMLSPQDANRYAAQLSAAAFRMNAALPRREPGGAGLSERQPQHSSASYKSPLGPPPGGSPWTATSSKLPDDGIGPIGNDTSAQRQPRPNEPVGEPEEVINRFAQRNSPAQRPAAQPNNRPMAGGQWAQWPGRSPAGEPPAGSPQANSERGPVASPGATQRSSLPRTDPLATQEPVRPQRQPPSARPTGRQPAPFGLEGYCPVTLLKKDLWKKGDPRFGVVHRGRTYLFAGQDEKAEFLKDPDGYSPVLAGVDPVLLADSGEAVEGYRAYGLYYENRIYLFTSEENLQRFSRQPEQFAGPVRQAMNNGTVDRLFR